jgi:uncharacterized protein (DUF2236 family)
VQVIARELGRLEFESRLGGMISRVHDPRHGFAGPGSLSWKLAGEAVLYAGGPRALLMQFAHPKVAQGVADHSHFRKDLLGRTVRTFMAVNTLLFGTVDEAAATARRIHRVHERVRGRLPQAAGLHAAGDPYAANDPTLIAWVWATLLDSTIVAYEQFVSPLTETQRERFYEESCEFSGLFGLPREAYPATHAEFVARIDEMIASGEVAVNPTARELAGVLTGQLGSLGPLFRLLAAGTLPTALREAFGLSWDPRTRGAYNAMRLGLRGIVRVVPQSLRTIPMATRAARRCRGVVAGDPAVALTTASRARVSS